MAFTSDETLDFHNRQIADVALGQRCNNGKQSLAYIFTSPLGHIYTNACPEGLHCVKLYGDTNYDKIKWNTKVDLIRASSLLARNAHVLQLKKWLQNYFQNPLVCKDIPISFCGLDDYGEFNSKVWMTIYDTCPPGELMSYSELAQRSGYGAGASKVVGYAINKNPYMLVVGDHRVVKATGEIWCENESQRNKLRRLLVHYEIPFKNETLEEALSRVRDRNERSKGTRKRSTSSKSQTKTETKIKKKISKSKTTLKKSRRTNREEDPESEEESNNEEGSDDDD